MGREARPQETAEELVATGKGHLSHSLRGNSMTATVQAILHTARREQAAPLLPVHTDNDQKSETTRAGEHLSSMYETLASISNTTTKTKPQDQPRCPT